MNYDTHKVYMGRDAAKSDWQVSVLDTKNGDIKPLNPRYDLANHSPDGFSWGYNGSGPTQLAVAMLADFTGDKDLALRLSFEFRSRIIANMDGDKDFDLTGTMLKQWLDDNTKLYRVRRVDDINHIEIA